MSRFFRLFFSLLFLVQILSCVTQTLNKNKKTEITENPETPETQERLFDVSAMSFNIKTTSVGDTGENSWNNRKSGISNMFLTIKPMVLGLQECCISQRNDILAKCSQYEAIGVGRDDGKEAGEIMLIMYDKTQMELIEWGTFWLSETPDKVSYGWDAECRRTTTWAIMKELYTTKKFLFMNTHLDHKGVVAREESLKLIQNKINEINQKNLPVILLGDFNEASANPMFNVLDLFSARSKAEKTDFGGTYNGFKASGHRQIDHIYYKGFSVLAFQIIRDSWNSITYISDHYPIMATFDFPEE